jgi:hypothetical protein
MAYVAKPNSGTLWPNKYKKQENHPDVKGDLHLDKALLENLIAKSKGNLVKIAVSGWSKPINGQKVLSLSASEPYEKEAAQDDGLPY